MRTMSKNRYKPYHPLEYAKQMADDGTAAWLQNLSLCEEQFKKAAKGLIKDGWIETEDEAIRLAHTTFTVADWLKFKQCYIVTKELAEDLFTMDDLAFPVCAFHMPFRTIYLDWESLEYNSVRNARPLGVYITIGDVPYGETVASFCSVVTIALKDGEYVFGGLSFDYYPEHMEMTLMETIETLTLKFDEERQLIINALLFAAYLSSEHPDVTENEAQKTIYRSSSKAKYSSVRKWDVGVRYTTERKKQQENPSSVRMGKGRRSPRPHMRKAHWQVYRIGPGRKGQKVLWIAPSMVGIRSTESLPVVIRDIKN